MTSRRRLLIAALSAGGHGLAVTALLLARGPEPRLYAFDPVPVRMIAPLPRPEPPPAPEPTEKPTPPKPKPPPPPKIRARLAKAPAPPDVIPIPAAKGPSATGESDVSDSELASASTADGDGGGGGCNMPRRLQSALRKSPLIQSTVAQAQHGRAIRVWNGSWVRHGAEDGAGLAAVREAIMWEVGFAPANCREERVRGLVMIAVGEGPGAARLVMGAGDWRWGDLLDPRLRR